MPKKDIPEIPVAPEEVQPECAHHWVKTHTESGHKALKCEFCGKVIDSQD